MNAVAPNMVSSVLAVLVAAEFFFIMYLETFATTSDQTAKTFKMDKQELNRTSVKTLFMNQGIYNGLLAVLILLATFAFPNKTALICLMIYILLVAAYGSLTSSKDIILKQGGLAFICLITLLVL